MKEKSKKRKSHKNTKNSLKNYIVFQKIINSHFLKQLQKRKSFHRASHNSFANASQHGLASAILEAFWKSDYREWANDANEIRVEGNTQRIRARVAALRATPNSAQLIELLNEFNEDLNFDCLDGFSFEGYEPTPALIQALAASYLKDQEWNL